MERGSAWIAAAVLLLIATGCGYATWMLIDLGETWVAKVVALLVTEPLGVACLLGAITIVAPDSLAAQWFAGALRRASITAFGLIFLFVTGTLGMFFWALWGYLTNR